MWVCSRFGSISTSYLTYMLLHQPTFLHSCGLSSWVSDTFPELKWSRWPSEMWISCLCSTHVCFQVSMGECIYLVSKQSSVFGTSSSGNQYLSHESRSSWLLWLPSTSPTPSLSLSISFASTFPFLVALSRSIFVFVFLLSFPVYFFPPLHSCRLPPTLPLLKNYCARLDSP